VVITLSIAKGSEEWSVLSLLPGQREVKRGKEQPGGILEDETIRGFAISTAIREKGSYQSSF